MEGGPVHLPVLRQETLQLLAPTDGDVIVDCTIGLGGHAEAMMRAAGPRTRLIGIDLDERNLRSARKRLEGFGLAVRLFQGGFDNIEEVLTQAQVDAADVLLADLGVASSQFDDPTRGLSFSVDGPLDMRLDQSGGPTAADIVNHRGEQELADLIYQYGEERYSRRIAKAIIRTRAAGAIERTTQLADIVIAAMPPAVRYSRRGVHPATRTFMALRIAVNDELGRLERLLENLPRVLKKDSRAAFISFHSLEDRRVKQAFSAYEAAGQARRLNKKPIAPGQQEQQDNPRSRSAKLRGLVWQVDAHR